MQIRGDYFFGIFFILKKKLEVSTSVFQFQNEKSRKEQEEAVEADPEKSRH